MTDAARKLLNEVLALPEETRAKIASAVLASLEGSQDAGWEDAWHAELKRREQVSVERGIPGTEWQQVRARIAARLDRE